MFGPDAPLPSALRAAARWTVLGPTGVPALLVRPPDIDPGAATPALIWMHGRTAHKEIDPGRYLRLMRAGMSVCALDLPGHGERLDSARQAPAATLDVILEMIDELDGVVADFVERLPIKRDRIAVGGMSAGGMVTLSRLCRPHDFRAAAVEATTGSWRHQAESATFRDQPVARIITANPMDHLDGWHPIPLQAIHTRIDAWVAYEGQAAFIEALRARYDDPSSIDFVTYESTGAPQEHAGFGRMAADAKNRQRDFLARWLVD